MKLKLHLGMMDWRLGTLWAISIEEILGIKMNRFFFFLCKLLLTL